MRAQFGTTVSLAAQAGLLMLAACAPPPRLVTLSPGVAATFVTPLSRATATPEPTAGEVASATPAGTGTATAPQPAAPSPAPTAPPTDTPLPLPTVRPDTLPPVPPTFNGQDHFIMGQPVGEGGNIYAASSYKYGSTYGGRLDTHHGNDLGNAVGAPVIAVAPGVVHWAGDDLTVAFGPRPNFYGNLIVLRLDPTWQGRAVYALYGHLSAVSVQAGQPVNRGEVIGQVGASGVALGAHLHIEVRLDNPESYWATRNPDLWIEPVPGTGVIAGRVVNRAGQYLPGARVVMLCSDGAFRFADTYWDAGVTPDEGFGENFAISGIPPGRCFLEVRLGEATLRETADVAAGQTTFVLMQEP